jgi:hypothetical protein
MVSRKNSGAGVRPLGHSPFGKEKLEGPKKHHDFHGTTDSVPGKGKGSTTPNEHWERLYDATDGSANMKATEGSDFNPKCPSERKTTHIKVNREDH